MKNPSQLNLYGNANAIEKDNYYDYFFLISPPHKIKEIVYTLKDKLDAEIGIDETNLLSVPHISLFKLRAHENDSFIINSMNYILSHVRRFEVLLNGAKLFTDGNVSKTLYSEIGNPQPIEQIFSALLKLYTHQTGRITPHLTIAKNIPNVGEIKDIHDYDLHGKFICDSITLLKKRSDVNENFENIHQSYLQSA